MTRFRLNYGVIKKMITYKSISRTGSRQINEDCTGMYQRETEYGFFLADGLGGHEKGEVASKTAVEQAILQFEAMGLIEDTLPNIFYAGQKAILEQQEKDHGKQGMKTTMTALLIGEQQIQWGHVGDSRIYYFQNNRLITRTLDHSVPQMLVAVGEIKEKDIRRHPDRNRLLKVMGIEWDSERPVFQLAEPIPRKGKQAFLMCSDGFWELINEKEMVSCLKKSKSVEDWMCQMEVLVKEHGEGTNMDNYSAVAVWISK